MNEQDIFQALKFSVFIFDFIGKCFSTLQCELCVDDIYTNGGTIIIKHKSLYNPDAITTTYH